MADSFTPLGGLVPLFKMHTGKVIFGGVGSGFYGVFVLNCLAQATPEITFARTL